MIHLAAVAVLGLALMLWGLWHLRRKRLPVPPCDHGPDCAACGGLVCEADRRHGDP